MSTHESHNLIVCPACKGAGGHEEVIDNSTRQIIAVMCDECFGAGKVLTTANTLPATVDSHELVELLGAHVGNPTIDSAMAVLRYCDKKMREHIAATYLLARQEGYDQATKDSGYVRQ